MQSEQIQIENIRENESVRDFLRYYCEMEKPPKYAVLLTGLWGSGKTWFIRNFLAEIGESPKDFLYVSLNGIASKEGIEDEFFKLIHPVFGSDNAQFVGKLIGASVKASVLANGVSLTFNTPSKIFKKIKPPKSALLVFDDIERCSMKLEDLFGYINQFIEHGDFKVILLADEKKIENDSYKDIKEKLIGRTFQILPELSSAFKDFVDELPSSSLKEKIRNNLQVVEQVYKCSKTENLRILRQSLWEFDRLCQAINSELLDSQPLFSSLLSVFLAHSFEIRSGHLRATEFKELEMSLYSTIGKKEGEENSKQKYVDIKKKYSGINLYENLIQSSLWQVMFSTGSIPSKEINESLANSIYFQNENNPNWIKFWYGTTLSDEAFDMLLFVVKSEWQNYEYTELEVVLHVAGLFLRYSEAEIYDKSVDVILDESKKYIDWLKDNNHLKPASMSRYFEYDSYDGLAFNSSEMREFKELCDYANEQRQSVLEKSYASEAKNILNTMKSDCEKFMHLLILSNHPDNKFYSTPILHLIDVDSFLHALLELEPEYYRWVEYVFEERYKHEQFTSTLIKELPWIIEVISLLENEISSRKGKISAYNLSRIVIPLKEAQKNLERASFIPVK